MHSIEGQSNTLAEIRDESSPKKVAVISMDYDGCYGIHQITKGDKESTLDFWERSRITKGIDTNTAKHKHQALFKQIISNIGEHNKVKIMVGSNRQDPPTDQGNSVRNGNGSCFEPIENIANILNDTMKTSSKSEFDGLLLADIFCEKPARDAINETHNYVIANGLKAWIPSNKSHRFIEEKIPLIYAQVHRNVLLYPDAEIDFYFYDDREDLLEGIKRYFEKFPDTLPKNVKLHLEYYKYSNNKVSKAPQLYTDVIKGTGLPDENYRNVIKGLPDDKERIKKVFDGNTNIRVQAKLNLLPVPEQTVQNIKDLPEVTSKKKIAGIVLGGLVAGAAVGAALGWKFSTAISSFLALTAIIPVVGSFLASGTIASTVVAGVIIGAIVGAIVGAVAATIKYKKSKEIYNNATAVKSITSLTFSASSDNEAVPIQ